MPEVYVSVDIEADGPIPGPYSMLSLGAAAFTEADEIAMAVTGCRFRDVGKRAMAAFLPKDMPHTHVVVEQGHVFMKLLWHARPGQ